MSGSDHARSQLEAEHDRLESGTARIAEWDRDVLCSIIRYAPERFNGYHREAWTIKRSNGRVMPAETQWDARLGTVLEGAYHITRLIGEGGMGAVYEAIQLRLNKRVAVKLMARQLTANQDALARFRREAEITSRLGHPHLVNVIDFGASEAGEPYLVMEYLEGEDLDQRLGRRGSLPVDLAVHITKQTASALAAAHAQGVVHRDLKPANVFLLHVPGELDFVKVLDFGISKVKAAGTRLTNASIALGTPNYMSPEQAAGRTDEIDHEVDQWALACIAWEMLCGHTPFVADDVSALFYQVMNLQPQSILLRVPGLAPEAEQVLLRALSKSPKDRFPSIRDFAYAFEMAALGRPGDVTPPPVMIPRVSEAGGGLAAVAPVQAAPIVSEGKQRTPKQVTTFSRSAGELTDEIPRRNWSRLGLRPMVAVIVLAAAVVMMMGTIFLLRPRQVPMAPVAIPVRPSVVTLPSVLPSPEPVSPPQPVTASKPAESLGKSAGGRSKPRKVQLGEAEDPFEPGASGAKMKGSKAAPPPPDLFHRNDTGRTTGPPQPKAKRTIIKEL
jgi:serine/threonine-protein kinase